MGDTRRGATMPEQAERLQAWAQKYRLFGWAVVPLNEERRPMFRWAQYRDDFTEYEADFQKWLDDETWKRAHGIGVLTEFSGVLIADIDVPEADASGHVSRLTGIKVGKNSIPYGISRTQSGHVHLFFDARNLPPERRRTIGPDMAKAIGFPNIEFKGDGSCVPLPPTRTAKGAYEWIHFPHNMTTSVACLIEPPGWVHQIYDRLAAHQADIEAEREAQFAERERERQAHEARIHDAETRGESVRLETPDEERKRGLKYEEAIPPTTEPGRTKALVSLCGKLCKAGFSETAVESALKAYAQRCSPTYPDDRFRAEVFPAIAKYANPQPRKVLDSLIITTKTDPKPNAETSHDGVSKDSSGVTTGNVGKTSPKEPHHKTPRIVSYHELMTTEYPPPTWLVHDLLPNGLSGLFGKPKIGKSWLALDMALSIAAEVPALGNLTTERGGVLYLGLEDPERRLQERIRVLQRDSRDMKPEIYIATKWARLDTDGAGDLRQTLDAKPSIRLVVVDTYGRVKPIIGRKTDLYQHDYDCAYLLKSIADERNLSVLIVHHLNKLPTTDDLDAISGTSAIAGAMDTAFILRRERNTTEGTLYITGRDVTERRLAMSWDSKRLKWTALGDADEVRMSDARREIVDLIRKAGRSMTPKEITDALGKNPNTVKGLCWDMSAAGQLVANDGRYSVPNTPTAPTAPTAPTEPH